MAPPSPTWPLDVEAIAGICGSISIACWVVVFSPQIIQQFRQGSADGLSVQFIIIWLLGDVFNIVGAVLQGVLPTMIILAVYYTLADLVLLCQCFYYRGFTWRDEPPPKPKSSVREPADERTSLLPGGDHHQRRASDWTGLSPAVSHVSELPEAAREPPSTVQSAAWNATIVAMVCAAGVLGWYLGEAASGGGAGDGGSPGAMPEFNVLGQVFGWLCAVAYIASRMPQLVLNWRRKTTDGLSMLFFLFACLGNVTYALSIVAYDPKCPDGCRPGEARRIYFRYMLVNLSWLAGSLLTLLMDLGVFVQHFVYKMDDDPGSDDDHWDSRPLLQRVDTGNL